MSDPIERCPCCGGEELILEPVIWDELASEWGLGPEERAAVDRQQGLRCAGCGCNLRSMALALAIMACHDYRGLFEGFVGTRRARRLRVLELNGAGTLTPLLARLPRRVEGSYPEVDMMAMPFADGEFDLVVHSDTLEHVPDPVRGLEQCRRVLRPGAFCCFTVPMIVGRLTASRDGKPPSYHGHPGLTADDFIVRTEYGADAWADVLRAGFRECRICTAEFPAAQALVGVS